MPFKRRLICVSEEFANLLESRIVREKHGLKAIKKHTKSDLFYNSFGDATHSLIPELRRIFK